MQNTEIKAKLHSALPPLCLPGHKKPTTCSGHQTSARSHRCKIPKPRRNRVQHKRHTAYRAINNRCHARAPKTSLGVTDAKHQNQDETAYSIIATLSYCPPGNQNIARRHRCQISNRSETPMSPYQTARKHRCYHPKLPGITGATISHCSEPPVPTLHIARSHRCKTPKSRRNRI